jgi:hypothetical protein
MGDPDMSLSEAEETSVNKRSISERLEEIAQQVDHLLRTAETDDLVNRLANIAKELSVVRLTVETPEAGDQRQQIRLSQRIASFCYLGESEFDCTISDISVGGALIQMDHPIPEGQIIALQIPSAGSILAEVMNNTPSGVHVAFRQTTEAQVIAILDSMQAALWR